MKAPVKRWFAAALAVCFGFAALSVMAEDASAQADPTSIGAGQKPYIMILMDTSASMEWTDKGDEQYPRAVEPGTTCVDDSGCPADYMCIDQRCLSDSMWTAESPIVESGDADDYGDDDDEPVRYGSCYMWEPEDCDDYERPAWYPTDEWTEAYGNGDGMEDRLGEMRANLATRMRDQSQPRHVTLKEILTGDMLLRPSSGSSMTVSQLSAEEHAPGCWLVPRQRGASAAQIEVCEGEDDFEDFPDHTEPRPHFQEVYEEQKNNGLMDLMASNAIFAIAMFDGYKEKQDGWRDHIDDDFNNDFGGVHEDDGDDDKNYNLGVYTMLTPDNLDISTSLMTQLSTFMQTALADAGYLSEDDGDHELRPDDKVSDELPFLGLSFSKDLKDYLKKHRLGKQPIARATPLAAAMHDIHQFFAEEYGPDSGDKVEDEHLNCRAKQVVMLTDGYPEPEAPGGVSLGQNSLNSAFGFDPDQYPYTHTEQAIEDFVMDRKNGSDLNSGYLIDPSGPTGAQAHKYDPRVHVVALNIDTSELPVVEKLAKMAQRGNTCAGYFLGEDFIPQTHGGDCPDGDNDPTTNCLDPRQFSYGYSGYVPPEGDTASAGESCDFPALILENNDRQSLTTALAQLFNSILNTAGTQSRTTPAFVSNLDDTVTDFGSGGQYRFFSGVRIEPTNPYWKGLMFREAQYCDTSATDGLNTGNNVAIHDEVADLGADPDNPEQGDRRRIFTSFASVDAYDYATGLPERVDTTTRFPFWRELHNESSMNSNDEFGDSYLDGTTSALIGGRVPFEVSTLDDAYEAIADYITTNTSETVTPQSYFGVSNSNDFVELLHDIRGRTEQQVDRLLGGILNGSPAAAEPPALDIPVDSYREYRARFGERVSMVYAPTIDGMLHAIYTGDVEQSDSTEIKVKKRDGRVQADGSGWNKSATNDLMHTQREAWAYIPQMLHQEYVNFQGQQSYLMDGTPVVKDVRLCNRNDDLNQNKQTCIGVDAGGNTIVPSAEQWRTVLVQGLGLAGSGFFALDVTRPGGPHGSLTDVEFPDPIPLWEFNPSWEMGQVAAMPQGQREALYYPRSSNLLESKDPDGDHFIGDDDEDCDRDPSSDSNGNGETDYFWDQPFLGTSVGEAAIGTTIVRSELDPDSSSVRRPVAVLSGGASGAHGTSCNRAERSGRSVYILDMQTGSMLRRFVDYWDPEESEYRRFPAPVTGSPSLYNAFPGSLVTRGFVGDAEGRLYRVDMSSSDPAEWELSLFFDPAEHESDLNSEGPYGPAAFKPALALGTDATNRNLLIFYGLGEPGDSTPAGDTQMVIALEEEFDTQQFNASVTAEADLLWNVNLGDDGSSGTVEREKLTGEPVVFNNAVYFTTYAVPGEDVCVAGRSRIWGLNFEGELDSAGEPTGTVEGVWDPSDSEFSSSGVDFGPGSPLSVWFSPEQEMLIRGLAVTLGPSCSTSVDGAGGAFTETEDSKPTLIAQTGTGADAGDLDKTAGSGSDSLSRIEKTLEPPASENIPLSWKVIRN